MATEIKTQPYAQSFPDLLKEISDPKILTLTQELADLFQAETGEEPVVWTGGIVGFGFYKYHYASGQSGTWMACGFAPRKTNVTLYLTLPDRKREEILNSLADRPLKAGTSCIYVPKTAKLTIPLLKELIRDSYRSVEDQRVTAPPQDVK